MKSTYYKCFYGRKHTNCLHRNVMQYTGVDNMAISVFDIILIRCISMGYMEWQNLQNFQLKCFVFQSRAELWTIWMAIWSCTHQSSSSFPSSPRAALFCLTIFHDNSELQCSGREMLNSTNCNMRSRTILSILWRRGIRM